MVHLIGLNYSAQAQTLGTELTEHQALFADCLRRVLEQEMLVLIAEEDSDEGLATRGKVSIAKQLADDRGIPHKFCDPTEQQVRDIGYRDGQSLELEIFHG